MCTDRKKVYSDKLLNISRDFTDKIKDIISKLGNDNVLNQGLFVMATSMFEDAIRQIMRNILITFPEKLKIKSCTINKDQVCDITKRGIEVIIDNELYALFREGIKEQLEYLFHIISNMGKSELPKEIKILICKCVDISLYRNSIVHNGGKPTEHLLNASIYKVNPNERNLFIHVNLEAFLKDYLEIFIAIEAEIKKHFRPYASITRLERLKDLWYECFQSPILRFEDYWEIDTEKDLITNIKHSKYENSISSGEKVYLSIWRHQYDDSIKTEEFLLCSINHEKISKLYNGLVDTQFYYMEQQSRDLKG